MAIKPKHQYRNFRQLAASTKKWKNVLGPGIPLRGIQTIKIHCLEKFREALFAIAPYWKSLSHSSVVKLIIDVFIKLQKIAMRVWKNIKNMSELHEYNIDPRNELLKILTTWFKVFEVQKGIGST
jgi:hypothetical protein